MAFYDTVLYCNAGDQSTTGYYAVAKRPQNAAVAVGAICRQFTAPAVGNERCFICIVAGTTANVTDATWTVTRGGPTVDGTVTWMECTGASALNGDLTNTPTWAAANAVGGLISTGVIIKRNSGLSYQICTTAGFFGSTEPAFSNTAGVTTPEVAGGSATWTSLGPVGNFTAGGAAPSARLGNVWITIDCTVYVGDNHAESQAAAITIAGNASSTLTKIICHNRAGSYPPTAADVATGATISSAANVSILTGGFYLYGLTFKAGGNCQLVATYMFADNCSFQATASTVGSSILVGQSGGANNIVFNNCTVGFGHIGLYVYVQVVEFLWRNTGPVLVGGSVLPTRLFNIAGSQNVRNVTLEALDLSQISSIIFGGNPTNLQNGMFMIKDCKLHASATICDPPGAQGHLIQTVRCDS